MATRKDAAAVEAVNEKAEVKTEAKKEPKFTVEKLRDKSMVLFGVTQSTFDGAMYGHDEGEYTVNEVKNIIEVWLYGKGGKK